MEESCFIKGTAIRTLGRPRWLVVYFHLVLMKASLGWAAGAPITAKNEEQPHENPETPVSV